MTEKDRRDAVRLLEASPEFNLYLLGNLESVGFEQEFCQFWGDYNGSGVLRAVLNRYMTGWSVYGTPTADWQGLGTIIDNDPIAATRLQDNPGGVVSLLPYLCRYAAEEIHTEELMSLDEGDFCHANSTADVTIRRAEPADLAALIVLYADAGHMSRSRAAVERPLRDTRIWLAAKGGELRSVALTNAESLSLAMIGGVFTPPQWRGKGLSQAVCSALCAELLAEGRRPVLYWDTPAAGKIYAKLGFRSLGQWRSVWLRKKM